MNANDKKDGEPMLEQKDVSILTSIALWLDQHTTFGAVIFSAWIAVLRMVYDGRHDAWKMMLEAVLCGSLTLALTSAMSVFGMEPGSASFIGGVVGFIGVDKVRSNLDRWLGRRAG